MAIQDERSEGSGKLYFRLATKKGEKQGIFYKVNGEKKFVGSISGNLVNITKELISPKEGGAKFTPFWQYNLELEDPQSTPSNIVLNLRRDARITDNIINTLSSITHPTQVTGMLEFVAWVKSDMLTVFVNTGQKDENGKSISLRWKYQWDSNASDFAGVPAVKEIITGVKDAAGKDVVLTDRAQRDLFFEKELNRVYGLLTGKSFIESTTAANTNTSPSANPSSFKEVLMAKVKKECYNHAILLDKWDNIVKWINSKISTPKEFEECKALVQAYLDTLEKGYTLLNNGTHTWEPKQSNPFGDSDDLPF